MQFVPADVFRAYCASRVHVQVWFNLNVYVSKIRNCTTSFNIKSILHLATSGDRRGGKNVLRELRAWKKWREIKKRESKNV